MTFSIKHLAHTKKYDGNLEIQTANGDRLPIAAVGNVPNSLPLSEVYFSPKLATNLLSIGQLVENKCTILFSSSGCLV